VLQLQEVLASALDRFDVNGDGHIDYPEFEAALRLLGIKLNQSSIQVLYRLLDPRRDGYLSLSEALDGKIGTASSMEKLTSAFEAAVKGQIKRKGLEKMSDMLKNSLAGGGSAKEKLQKGLSHLPFEVLQDSVGNLVDGAAFLTASNCILREIEGLDSWDKLEISSVAPLFVFLGLSGAYMLRELTKEAVKDLTQNEALLYAQLFRSYGFSRLEFRQLLRQADATWEESPDDGERVLDGNMLAQRLCLVVHGGCKLYSTSSQSVDTPSLELSIGGTIGEEPFLGRSSAVRYSRAVLEPGTRLVCWDVERLCKHLALHEATEHQLHGILAEAAARKFFVPQDPSGFIPRQKAAATD